MLKKQTNVTSHPLSSKI